MGVAATVISYRLQPGATWRDQVADVAAALAWTQSHATDWGGDPNRVAMMGHSAGRSFWPTSCSTTKPASRPGARPACAAIVASGAALDLVDPATWATGTRFGYYSARFSPDQRDMEGPPEVPYDWQVAASPVAYVTADAPPFLTSTASGEDELFETQADALARALDAVGVTHERVETPALAHSLGVPNLSRDDRVIGPAAVDLRQALLPLSGDWRGGTSGAGVIGGAGASHHLRPVCDGLVRAEDDGALAGADGGQHDRLGAAHHHDLGPDQVVRPVVLGDVRDRLPLGPAEVQRQPERVAF